MSVCTAYLVIVSSLTIKLNNQCHAISWEVSTSMFIPFAWQLSGRPSCWDTNNRSDGLETFCFMESCISSPCPQNPDNELNTESVELSSKRFILCVQDSVSYLISTNASLHQDSRNVSSTVIPGGKNINNHKLLWTGWRTILKLSSL